MKRQITLLLSALMLLTTSQYALARPHGGHGGGGRYHGGGRHHGGHSRHSSHIGFDFIIGGPGYWSSPYYSSYPYYPYYPYPTTQTVVVKSQPTQYVERAVEPTENKGQDQYWYYCSNPKGYYPYVRNCTVDWKRVQPFPNDAQ